MGGKEYPPSLSLPSLPYGVLILIIIVSLIPDHFPVHGLTSPKLFEDFSFQCDPPCGVILPQALTGDKTHCNACSTCPSIKDLTLLPHSCAAIWLRWILLGISIVFHVRSISTLTEKVSNANFWSTAAKPDEEHRSQICRRKRWYEHNTIYMLQRSIATCMLGC